MMVVQMNAYLNLALVALGFLHHALLFVEMDFEEGMNVVMMAI